MRGKALENGGRKRIPLARKMFGVGCVIAAAAGGCATQPPLDNPTAIREPNNSCNVENPILVSPGVPTAVSYAELFEKVYAILDDYFVIPPGGANRYEGRIATLPRVTPGYEQFWKGGNPDPRERLRATFQSMRQTATVEIRSAERGGYLVLVIVEQELEDLARPSRATIGSAAFRDQATVGRTTEVVTPDSPIGSGWYKVGRDYACEQMLLRRIRECP